jgi:hypothetical protein
MKIIELFSSQSPPTENEEIYQNLELRITNIDENLKSLQKFLQSSITNPSGLFMKR